MFYHCAVTACPNIVSDLLTSSDSAVLKHLEYFPRLRKVKGLDPAPGTRGGCPKCLVTSDPRKETVLRLG